MVIVNELPSEYTSSGEKAHRYQVIAESFTSENFPALILDTVENEYSAVWRTNINITDFKSLISNYLNETERQVTVEDQFTKATIQTQTSDSETEWRSVTGSFSSIMNQDFIDIEYLSVRFGVHTLSWLDTGEEIRLLLDESSADITPLQYFYRETPVFPITPQSERQEDVPESIEDDEQNNVTNEASDLIQENT